MTYEELLKKHGVDPSQWQEVGGGAVETTLLKKQREGIEKVRDMLEEKVVEDKRLAAILRERLLRMKHGGGR